MSLLEDVFLQDEAGEAQELERIIEGDEFEERVHDNADSNENSEKEDEAEEDKRRVDPGSTKVKRVVKNPRFILNPARLTGPRGIQVLPDHFKDFKFKGKGNEKEDLDLVLKKLEHWAYRLYPKFKFEDCLKKIETLGKKRPVMVHLHKIRSDQFTADDQETVVQKDSSDEEAPAPPEEDEFDQLLQQQIDLARTTPGPGDRRPGFNTPAIDKRSPLMMPKATSSPSISDEQKERMMRNRKLAEERRLARLKATTVTERSNAGLVDLTDVGNSNTLTLPDHISHDLNVNGENKAKKHRSNVIDSSDDDSDEVNKQTVAIDVHNTGTPVFETDAQENSIDLTKTTSVNVHKDRIQNYIDLTETIPVHRTGNKNSIDLTETAADNGHKTGNQNSIDLTGTVEIDAHRAGIQNSIDLTETSAVSVHITSDRNSIDLTKAAADGVQKIWTQNSINLTEGTTINTDVDLNMERIRNENGQRNYVDIDSDDDNLVINETIAQVSENESDVTERYQKANEEDMAVELDAEENKNKQNDDLDDSEGDCSVTTMNQSIVVDIYNTVSTKNGLSDKRSLVKTVSSLNNDDSERNDADENMIVAETLERHCEGNYTQNSIKIIGTNKGIGDASKNIDVLLDKENIDNNISKGDEVFDDLMDVDFSDDF